MQETCPPTGDAQDGSEPDPVAANRAAHPRRTPGRAPLGIGETRRVTIAVMLVVSAATMILIAFMAAANPGG